MHQEKLNSLRKNIEEIYSQIESIFSAIDKFQEQLENTEKYVIKKSQRLIYLEEENQKDSYVCFRNGVLYYLNSLRKTMQTIDLLVAKTKAKFDIISFALKENEKMSLFNKEKN